MGFLRPISLKSKQLVQSYKLQKISFIFTATLICTLLADPALIRLGIKATGQTSSTVTMIALSRIAGDKLSDEVIREPRGYTVKSDFTLTTKIYIHEGHYYYLFCVVGVIIY